MTATQTRSTMETRAAPVLLTYRPWRGTLRGPAHGTLAIARVSLFLLVRRKLLWGLYAVSAMIFLLMFYGQYLQAWLQTQIPDEPIPVASAEFGRPYPPRGENLPAEPTNAKRTDSVKEAAPVAPLPKDDRIRVGPASLITLRPRELMTMLKNALHLDGSGYTFRNFFNFEAQIVMIVLALAGAILVGNDFRFGSLPFYLSKPLHRWHYLGGKFLAVGVFINLMTTVPALVLFAEYGMIESWSYYRYNADLALGIIAYGLVLTVVLGLLLLATASWLRRTVPMIMVWTGIFVFARLLADLLVYSLHLDARCKLIDLWNDMFLVGNWCLGMAPRTIRAQPQPEFWEAAAVLAAVCGVCVVYLNRRIRAVEVA